MFRVKVENSKVMVVRGGGVAPQVEVGMKGESMEVESSLKCLGSCFGKDGGPQEDVKMRVCEGRKTFGELKRPFNVSRLSLVMKRELYEGMIAPTVIYGRETVGITMREGHKLDFFGN